MKLAEALALRADLQKKIQSLRIRIARGARIQEGTKPAEDPEAMLAEAFGAMAELRGLLVKINLTNTHAALPDGQSITAAVAARDELISKHSLLEHTLQAAQERQDRYSASEIKWITPLPIAQLQKQLEGVAKQIRELNLAIQKANWEIDLETA